MANMITNKIAHATGCNYRLNRRILCIKRSWDEVSKILQHARCGKSSCCNSPCHKKRKW